MSDMRASRKRHIRKRHICLVLLYALILAGILFGWVFFDDEEPAVESYGSLTGRFESDISVEYAGKTMYYRESEITNYLLIGMDREDMDPADYQDGGQADFLLMLSVDRVNRTITPVMIDRDTMTPVQTYGTFGNAAGTRTMQICLAQAYSGSGVSGSDNTSAAVSGLLYGVKIDRCLVMDLGGIVLLNDAVGGVTVTLEDDMTVLDPALVKGGTVHLTGELAEHFVRGRRTVADGTNAARMRRQSAYIDALVSQIRLKMAENDNFAKELMNILSGHMQSDTPENTLISEANAYGGYEWQPLQTLPGTHRTGEDGFAEFWPDEPALSEIIVDIWFE